MEQTIRKEIKRDGKVIFVNLSKPKFERWVNAKMGLSEFASMSGEEKKKAILLYSYGLSEEANENLYISEKDVINFFRGKQGEYARQRVAWWEYIEGLIRKYAKKQKRVYKEAEEIIEEFDGRVVG